MVANTDIKFYVHTNNNAPQLQNAYGSMINALDACLVNGINIGSVSSLTVLGTTVTALFSSAHNLMQYQVVKITGANQVEFNGEHRILTVPNAQSVTFEVAAVPSATTATGTITASLPALGWEKPFSSTHSSAGGKAAYRSKNTLLLSRPFLRVVDELDPAYTATYAKYAKVGVVEDMIDIDTMLGVQAPFDIANPNKNWVATGSGTTAVNGWAKWYYSRNIALSIGQTNDSVNRVVDGPAKYTVVGTRDAFFILNDHYHSGTNSLVYAFGHMESETRDVFLSATMNNAAANSSYNLGMLTGLGGFGQTSLAQVEMIKKQDGTPVRIGGCAASALSTAVLNFYSGSSNYFSGENILSETYLFDSHSMLRGKIPLLHFIYAAKPFINQNPVFHQNKVFLPIDIVSYSQYGQVAFDLIGGK